MGSIHEKNAWKSRDTAILKYKKEFESVAMFPYAHLIGRWKLTTFAFSFQ